MSAMANHRKRSKRSYRASLIARQAMPKTMSPAQRRVRTVGWSRKDLRKIFKGLRKRESHGTPQERGSEA